LGCNVEGVEIFACKGTVGNLLIRERNEINLLAFGVEDPNTSQATYVY
jgi:hypothetical protein